MQTKIVDIVWKSAPAAWRVLAQGGCEVAVPPHMYEVVEAVLHPETRVELVKKYEILSSEALDLLTAHGADELSLRHIYATTVISGVIHPKEI